MTIADLRSSLAGVDPFPGGVLGWMSSALSERAVCISSTSAAAASNTRWRLFFAATIAGPVITASFRPFRFGGGL